MKGTIMTINAIKDEYLRICRFERKLSPNTVRAYAFTLQDFSDFLKSVRLLLGSRSHCQKTDSGNDGERGKNAP